MQETTENTVTRQLELKISYYQFVLEFWDVVVKEEYIKEWYHEYICEQLELIGRGIIQRKPKLHDLIINIPPSHSKTTLTTILFPCWLLANDPTIKIINASYSGALSQEAVVKSRDIIKSDKWQKYFSHIKIRRDKDNKGEFELLQGGGRFATSVGGTVTGKHALVLIADDPLSAQQAFSQKETETANQWFSNTFLSRKINADIATFILIMQRLSFNDCTAYLLEKLSRVKHISLASEIHGNISPPSLAKNYINGLLSPNRFSNERLLELRKELSSFIYAGQYEQRPAPLEGGILKEHWFQKISKIEFDKLCLRNHYSKVAMIDSSEGKNGRSDKTGIIIGTYIQGIIYVEYFYHKRMNIVETISNLDNMLIRFMNPNHSSVFAEPKSTGTAISMLTNWKEHKFRVGNYAYPKFEKAKALLSISKLERTQPLLGKYEAGVVKLVENDSNAEFLHQIKCFPDSGVADEAIDCLNMLGYYFIVQSGNTQRAYIKQ